MRPALAALAMPALRRMDPETAHRVALRALRHGWAGKAPADDDQALRVRVLGIDFRNPVGLAAGFDKDAVALPALARLGFGHIETGTVTRNPQAGNPRPRQFRLDADQAVINRMGFNNSGLSAYLLRLAEARRSLGCYAVPIGANVGLNREGADPERDYPALVEAVAPHVDYTVINISSPNTPGLRDLQAEARLRAILAAVGELGSKAPKLLVKLSPDLSDAALEAVVRTCIEANVDGLVISNTTTERADALRSAARGETGGLSGAPLFASSTRMLARAYQLTSGRLALIGVGGVFNGWEALAKIRAGAHLVQTYTAFAYAGPALVVRLKAELGAALRTEGFNGIGEAVGSDANRLAG